MAEFAEQIKKWLVRGLNRSIVKQALPHLPILIAHDRKKSAILETRAS
jgi:hypothetical protein